MNDLGILKDVGLKEVARKTHIEPEFLQAIVDKNFERLVRLNIGGYLKILQREYDIDVSAWLEEFELYKKEHASESKKPKVNPKITSYTATESPSKSGSGGLGWIIWFALLAGVLGAGYYFDAHKYIQQLPELIKENNQSANYTDVSVVQEVANNITTPVQVEVKVLEINVATEQNLTEANITQATTPSEVKHAEPVIEHNLTSATLENVDANLTGKLVVKADNAVFLPKASVWSGVIDLKSGKKNSRTTSEPVNVDAKGEFLIVFGNGNVELKTSTQSVKFDPGRAARFLVKNGEIRSLSYDEFVELNKGKSW